MACDLYCPSCGAFLGKDTECNNPAYCSTCMKDDINNPRGYPSGLVKKIKQQHDEGRITAMEVAFLLRKHKVEDAEELYQEWIGEPMPHNGRTFHAGA